MYGEREKKKQYARTSTLAAIAAEEDQQQQQHQPSSTQEKFPSYFLLCFNDCVLFLMNFSQFQFGERSHSNFSPWNEQKIWIRSTYKSFQRDKWIPKNVYTYTHFIDFLRLKFNHGAELFHTMVAIQ